MKKNLKIVLITALLALPALGTYVKTALPNVGSATNLTLVRTAARIQTGDCQECNIAASIQCNNSGKRLVFADPIMGGMPAAGEETDQDFPVNFLFKVIPFQELLPVTDEQHNMVIQKPGRYMTAAML